jgi:hypothetical protein
MNFVSAVGNVWTARYFFLFRYIPVTWNNNNDIFMNIYSQFFEKLCKSSCKLIHNGVHVVQPYVVLRLVDQVVRLNVVCWIKGIWNITLNEMWTCCMHSCDAIYTKQIFFHRHIWSPWNQNISGEVNKSKSQWPCSSLRCEGFKKKILDTLRFQKTKIKS